MSSAILPGVIRGLGRARIKFDLAYKNKKIGKANSKKFSFLEKLNLKDREFSRTAIFKTLKFFAEPEPEEVLFWTVLKLIYAEENGGICYPKKDLKEFILKKNPNLEPEKLWISYFESNQSKPLLSQDGDMIYLSHLYLTEITVCEYLQPFFETNFEEKFKPYKDKTLSEEQTSIVNSIFQNSISFLSGGPGTGKTTIIQAILKSGIENGIHPSDISILAPTGKAAKRLQESCSSILSQFESLDAPSTIHRFLGYNPTTGKCKFNLDNPSSKKLIIIDESSMLDIFILKVLLEACPNFDRDRRFIFVGDPDQLLSVNSGSVFSDFVKLNKNTFKLTRSFRQTTEGEEIKSIASKIQSISTGDTLTLPDESITVKKEFKEITSGVHFIEVEKEEASLDIALAWYKNLSVQSLIGQILTPYNETKIGVKNVNAFIQQKLNKDSKQIDKLPVVVNSNLYDLNLFNGESGYLIESATSNRFIHSEKKEIEISNSYRQYFDAAFAITVHKSQGSEYDHICLLLPAELETPDSLLNIRILYTAITRAKKSVTIVGSPSLFFKALANKGEERHSRIVDRLSVFES
ncbi:MAG: AAA family ATPase [Leptospiraceae bacterium]|nr:AAA family ATPase [Leptospiraceae bacterium]